MNRDMIFCQKCGKRMPADSSSCPRCDAPVHGPSGRGFKGRASSRYVIAIVFMFFAMGFLIGSIYAPWYALESDFMDLEEYSDRAQPGGADAIEWEDFDDSAVADLYLGFINIIYAAIGVTAIAFLLMLLSGSMPRRDNGVESLITLLIVLGFLIPLAGAGYYASAHTGAWDDDIDQGDADGPWDSFMGESDDGEWYPTWGFFLFLMGGIASVLSLLAFRSASKMDRAMTRQPRQRGRAGDRPRQARRPVDRRDDRRRDEPRDDYRRDDRDRRDDRYDDRPRDDRGYDRDYDRRDDRGYDDRGYDRRDDRGYDRDHDRRDDRGYGDREPAPREERGHDRKPDPRSDGPGERKWYDEPERDRDPEGRTLPAKHEIRR